MTASTKKAQGGGKGKGRAALKEKACEVIKDVRQYDADARRAVWLALTNLNFAETNPPNPPKYTEAGFCERELREVIEKVKKGVPVFDTERFAPGVVEGAFAVYRMLEPRDTDAEVPDFIINAVRVALEEAARRYDSAIWLDVDGTGASDVGGLSVAAIAYLFQRVGTRGVEVEPARDLAGLISGVLTHDEVPNLVYEKLTDALVELHDSTDVYQDPAAVRALLDYHARRREENEQAEGEGGK